MGPYVENLSAQPALSVNDIEGYIALGSKYRATASTNMNVRGAIDWPRLFFLFSLNFPFFGGV